MHTRVRMRFAALYANERVRTSFFFRAQIVIVQKNHRNYRGECTAQVHRGMPLSMHWEYAVWLLATTCTRRLEEIALILVFVLTEFV